MVAGILGAVLIVVGGALSPFAISAVVVFIVALDDDGDDDDDEGSGIGLGQCKV